MQEPIGFGTQFKEDVQSLMQSGKFAEVLLLTERLLRLTVPDVFVAELHRARAQAYDGLADREAALLEWTRVIKILPADAAAYEARAAIRETAHDGAGAALDSARAAELRTSAPRLPSGTGPDPVAAAWEHAAAVADSRPSLRGYCCRARNSSGHNANCVNGNADLVCGRAEADCTAAIALDPSDARAYLHRAFVRACRRDPQGTERDCAEAIALDPELAEAYCLRGTVYEKRGELERAVAEWTRTIELNPQDAYAYSLRELAYEELGEDEKAAADGRRAFELNKPRRRG